MTIKITKGLDIPIKGRVTRELVSEDSNVSQVAILGDDYKGMRPTFHVKVGDEVKAGDILFTDKKNEKVCYTSFINGKVVAINRGERRSFRSLVIGVGKISQTSFKGWRKKSLHSWRFEDIKYLLIKSGEWTSIRSRPFGKVADHKEVPSAIFINAMDTNPLSFDPSFLVDKRQQDFSWGLSIIKNLTKGKTYLCQKEGRCLVNMEDITVAEFKGPHPSGNVGTHIHFLDPVARGKSVWYLGIQDLIAIGQFFRTGVIDPFRVVSIGGPLAKVPRLVKTLRGANLSQLLDGQVKQYTHKVRVISGPVLNGREKSEDEGFLGRYHQQVVILSETNQKKILGWMLPGMDQFSVKNVFLSSFLLRKKYNFSASQKGSLRSIVPFGSFEKVFPLRMLPTLLLKALASGDLERSEQLGCLELEEEDLALCSFVDPCKNDFGKILRQRLDEIERN